MNIQPAAELKPLAECELGELVRYRAFQHDVIALVARHEDKSFFVELSGEAIGGPPCYRPAGDADTVLSYGRDYELVVDHLAEVELRKYRLYETAGCLVRTPAAWLIRIAPASGQGLYNGAYYNVETATLSPLIQDVDAVTFTTWLIQLPAASNCEQPIPLFVHKPKGEDGEA